MDLQRGFTELAPEISDPVLKSASTLLTAFRKAKLPVVHVRVRYGLGEIDAPTRDVDMPTPSRELPPTWHDFDHRVAPIDDEAVIDKQNWGAFGGTALDLQLRRRGISGVVLTGIATNFAVEGTAREASALSYSIIVASDACSSLTPELHQFSVENVLPRIARVRTTSEVCAWVGAGSHRTP